MLCHLRIPKFRARVESVKSFLTLFQKLNWITRSQGLQLLATLLPSIDCCALFLQRVKSFVTNTLIGDMDQLLPFILAGAEFSRYHISIYLPMPRLSVMETLTDYLHHEAVLCTCTIDVLQYATLTANNSWLSKYRLTFTTNCGNQCIIASLSTMILYIPSASVFFFTLEKILWSLLNINAIK